MDRHLTTRPPLDQVFGIGESERMDSPGARF